jgi:hypothetical protein
MLHNGVYTEAVLFEKVRCEPRGVLAGLLESGPVVHADFDGQRGHISGILPGVPAGLIVLKVLKYSTGINRIVPTDARSGAAVIYVGGVAFGVSIF